jgi:hypothetical protein
MALIYILILRNPRSGCLEGRTVAVPRKLGSICAMGTGFRRCEEIFSANIGPLTLSESAVLI